MILRSIKFKICHLYKNDLNYFIDGLKILNIELMNLNSEHFNVYCVGGFVMLSYGLRRSSKDIDAYFEVPDDPVFQKALSNTYKIIRKGWLNNEVQKSFDHRKDFLSLSVMLNIPEIFEIYLNLEKITVLNANLDRIFLMKLYSFREDFNDDISDLINIINYQKMTYKDCLKILINAKSDINRDDWNLMIVRLSLLLLDFNMIDHEQYEEILKLKYND